MILRNGSRGQKVKTLQYLLNNNVEPDPGLTCDGVFGRLTEEAVKRFQHQERLTVDGIVGPKTWRELGDMGVEEAPVCGGVLPVWMHVALEELRRGVREVAGERDNPRIIAYHATTAGLRSDEEAWCSSFVNWCIQQSGMTGTGRANARSWNGWGRQVMAPQYGDIVVLWRESPQSWRGHVGFFLAFRDQRKVLLLGGNQGNAVSIAAYPRRRILSFRRPS